MRKPVPRKDPTPGARRGRPRKFSRPSSSTTLTLPDDVVEALKTIDHDLSRAVVRLVQPLMTRRGQPTAAVTFFGDRGSLLLLNPSRALERYTGAELLALSDGRAIVSFAEDTSLADFEISLRDALEDPALPDADRPLFEQLVTILRRARVGDGVVLTERRIILLQSRPQVVAG